jgi:ferredoxin-thioredoxin reductase catalytic subunit
MIVMFLTCLERGNDKLDIWLKCPCSYKADNIARLGHFFCRKFLFDRPKSGFQPKTCHNMGRGETNAKVRKALQICEILSMTDKLL